MTSILSHKNWVFNATYSNEIISKTQNIVSFYSAFLKSTSNFEYFEKKDEPHSWCISKIIDCKMCVYLNA